MPNPYPERPVRILHVFGRLNRGGAELRTIEIMKAVQKSPFHMSFCVLSGMPGELDSSVQELGGEVFPVKLNALFPWRFRRLLEKHHFDVIHSHVHFFSGYILRIAYQAGIHKRIAHFRNTSDGGRSSAVRFLRNKLLKHWINAYATDILGVCCGVMNETWGDNWGTDPRCRVVYNGIDAVANKTTIDKNAVLKSLKLPLDCPLVIHVARQTPQKNHVRLIEIFAELHKLEPAAQLLLVGRETPSIKKAVQHRVKNRGLADKVHFAGERSDVCNLLQIADLMLLPSQWEGLPGVVLEACLARTPILASELPGVQEIQCHFPDLITTLPLGVDDQTWAKRAAELLNCPVDVLTREEAVKVFSRTIFDLEYCVRQMCKVWTRRVEPLQRKPT